jgi:hypothetical protein
MIRAMIGTQNVLALMIGSMAVSLIQPIAASADEIATAADISTAVSDHTYQGSMNVGGSGFAEYYAPDGTIRADGYAGKWRTEDGVMCFQYGEKPETCFEVKFNGPSMEMYKDGELDGNGMLIQGNPQGF